MTYNPNYRKIVEKSWVDLPDHCGNIKLNEYIIMPNHFHGIITITVAANPVVAHHESPDNIKYRRKMLLPKIIGRFKMTSAKQINMARNTPGISVWQRNYYEHIIRDDESFYRISEYIKNNPASWQMDDYYA